MAVAVKKSVKKDVVKENMNVVNETAEILKMGETVKTNVVLKDIAMINSEEVVANETKQVAMVKPKSSKKVGDAVKNEYSKKAEELISLIEYAKSLEAQQKIIKNKIDEIKENLKPQLKELGVDWLKVEEHKICFSMTDKLNFDTTKFKKDNPKLYEDYRTKKVHSETVLFN